MYRFLTVLMLAVAGLLSLLAGPDAQAVTKKRVAFFQIKAISTQEVYAQKMFAELRRALASSKKLSLTSEQKEELTKQIELKRKSGCTEVECLTQVGIELGVEKVLSGELLELPGSGFELHLYLVDVASEEYEFVYTPILGTNVSEFQKMAGEAVDMIDSKIIIQPTLQSVEKDGTVIIDAGFDLGVEKGTHFSVRRVLERRKDSRGKVFFEKFQELGEIEITAVQPIGSSGKIIRKLAPMEQGDIAVVDHPVNQIDEGPGIVHSRIEANVQGMPLLIQADIVSLNRIDSAVVWWRNPPEQGFHPMRMTSVGKERYEATIPAEAIHGASFEYYLSAADSNGQETEKRGMRNSPFSVLIVKDEEPPTVEHTAKPEVNASEGIDIRATVKDNVRVASVKAFVRINMNGDFVPRAMIWQGGNSYAVRVPDSITDTARVVQYYIEALDQAGNAGHAGSSSHPAVVNIVTKDILGPQIVVHSPVRSFQPGVPLTIEAQISDRSGVGEASVYIKADFEATYQKTPMHPYAGNLYRASILRDLNALGSSRLQYYFLAVDSAGNEQLYGTSEVPFEIFPKVADAGSMAGLKAEEEAPYVYHFPPKILVHKELGYPMLVNINDESGIKRVVVYYHGPGEKEFKQSVLRKGSGAYEGYIPGTIEPLTYFIECRDLYDNVTWIGSRQSPIMVNHTETLQGPYPYIAGVDPYIPPLAIRFTEPAELSELGELMGSQDPPLKVNLELKGKELRVEGIVQSTRECFAVYVDTTWKATLLPLSLEERNALGSSARAIKFVCTLPPHVDGSVLSVTATDILDKQTNVRLKLNNGHTGGFLAVNNQQAHGAGAPNPQAGAAGQSRVGVSTVPQTRISILQPALADDETGFEFAGGGKLKLSGTVLTKLNVALITVTLDDTVGVTTHVKREGEPKGFTTMVAIPGGNHVLRIAAKMENGSIFERKITVRSAGTMVDASHNIPPVIEFISPHGDQYTTFANAAIRARITDNLRVDSVMMKNGDAGVKNLHLRREGDAMVLVDDTVTLKPGQNVIQITATNGHQRATKSIILDFKRTPQEPGIFVIFPVEENVTESPVPLHFTVSGMLPGMKVSVSLNDTLVFANLAEGKSLEEDEPKTLEFQESIRVLPGASKIKISVFKDEMRFSLEKSVMFGRPKLDLITHLDPVVRQNKLELIVSATNLGEQGSIWYVVNGKRTIPAAGTANGPSAANTREYKQSIVLQEGVNTIQVLARNRCGSDSIGMTIRLKQSQIPNDKYFALLIGVQDYPNIPGGALDYPLADASSLRDVLVNQYTFEKENITLLENPDRAKIILTMQSMEGSLGESDNLLIFFAGHGHFDENKDQGFWFPSDATDAPTQWISDGDIQGFIRGFRARHVLLVADACFGGAILNTTRGMSRLSPSIKTLYEKMSRNAMTSGGLDNTPDKSVFMHYLVKHLHDNKGEYLTSAQLFRDVSEIVTINSKTRPRFGIISGVGDELGDFIFVRRPEPQPEP